MGFPVSVPEGKGLCHKVNPLVTKLVRLRWLVIDQVLIVVSVRNISQHQWRFQTVR